MPQHPRIVIALPDLAENAAVADWLSGEGFDCVRRPAAKAAAEETQSRPYDLLIADAAFALSGQHRFGRSRHPLTPVVVVGDALVATQCEAASWAMYLARPVDHALLVCTALMAILDGRPTRCSERKLVNRFAATVNGVQAHIIDISNEGVRLEIPRERCTVPPPYFTVRVPLIGVGVTVRRMWARPSSSSGRENVTLCGGALAENPARAEGGWRSFVDTLPTAGAPRSDSIEFQ